MLEGGLFIFFYPFILFLNPSTTGLSSNSLSWNSTSFSWLLQDNVRPDVLVGKARRRTKVQRQRSNAAKQ